MGESNGRQSAVGARLRIGWPLAVDRVCLAFTWRSTIHASSDDAGDTWKSVKERGVARTVCGIDAPPTGHQGAGTDWFIVAPWPPPARAKDADRCPDCVARLGTRARVNPHWHNLIDREGASA